MDEFPVVQPSHEAEVQSSAPQVVEFAEKIKAYLAFGFLATFLVIVLAWSFHAPQLPGDAVGLIVGGMLTVLGNLGGYYWSGTGAKPKDKTQ